MPKVSALKKISKRLEVYIEVLQCKIEIYYFPGIFSPAFEAAIERKISNNLAHALSSIEEKGKKQGIDPVDVKPEVVDGEDNELIDAINAAKFNAMVHTLHGLLDKWDLSDDDDVHLPVTPEILVDLGYPVLSAIFEEIKEDMKPKKAKSSS